ncbi:MAG TPA: YggT family protein [Candidatus Saccharimonas sp.]|nr:YggT family protein [Candidatus Saccharimonas sp.]
MAEHIYETHEAVTAGDSPVGTRSMAVRLVDWLTSVLLALLAIRFLLSALGANPANAFANLIYTLSYPLVAPFFGLFGYTVHYGVAHIELETLVAIAVYALVGYGIARLLAATRPSSD